MEGNKLIKKTKIILGIGFVIAIIGIMLIGVEPDLGCGISLGLTLLYLFIVVIKAQAKSQELECKFCGHTMIVQKENTYRE